VYVGLVVLKLWLVVSMKVMLLVMFSLLRWLRKVISWWLVFCNVLCVMVECGLLLWWLVLVMMFVYYVRLGVVIGDFYSCSICCRLRLLICEF